MQSHKQEPRGATGEDERATIKTYLAEIGRRGGQKSKRKLTKAQARAMVRARTAKRDALRPNDELKNAGPRTPDVRES